MTHAPPRGLLCQPGGIPAAVALAQLRPRLKHDGGRGRGGHKRGPGVADALRKVVVDHGDRPWSAPDGEEALLLARGHLPPRRGGRPRHTAIRFEQTLATAPADPRQGEGGMDSDSQGSGRPAAAGYSEERNAPIAPEGQIRGWGSAQNDSFVSG
eukprot:gene1840-biopygen5238